MGILARQHANDETYECRNTDEETQYEKHVAVATHPAVGAIVCAKMRGDGVWQILRGVDNEHGSENREANQHDKGSGC